MGTDTWRQRFSSRAFLQEAVDWVHAAGPWWRVPPTHYAPPANSRSLPRGDSASLISRLTALRHLRSPCRSRRGGADHVFTLTYDFGRCLTHAPNLAPQGTQTAIKSLKKLVSPAFARRSRSSVVCLRGEQRAAFSSQAAVPRGSPHAQGLLR